MMSLTKKNETQNKKFSLIADTKTCRFFEGLNSSFFWFHVLCFITEFIIAVAVNSAHLEIFEMSTTAVVLNLSTHSYPLSFGYIFSYPLSEIK